MARFVEQVGPFLREQRTDVSPLILRLGSWITGSGPAVASLGGYAYRPDGTVVGAAVNQVGSRVLLSPMPPAAVSQLEEALGASDPSAPMITGPAEVAAAFAERRAARLGWQVRPGRRIGTHVAGPAREPPPAPPGAAYRLGRDDIASLASWLAPLQRYVPAGAAAPDDPLAAGHYLLDCGPKFLWTVDAEPVAFTGYAGPLWGMADLGPGYTAPEHRGCGYMSALVHVVMGAAREAGADLLTVSAFVDNVASNQVVARAGFELSTEVRNYELSDQP